jgi:hypothetical protein
VLLRCAGTSSELLLLACRACCCCPPAAAWQSRTLLSTSVLVKAHFHMLPRALLILQGLTQRPCAP